MNKHQIKGALKAIVGKVQKNAGKLVGSKKYRAKGRKKQIFGKAEELYGDVKEAIKHATRRC